MKGIILAGGKGRRLGPTTLAVNKQLLMLFDKPIIFYPLSVLLSLKIKDILIIVNPHQIENFKKILGNGSHLGIKISYKVQKKPSGIPEAFILGKEFIKNNKVCLILGDNFFYNLKLNINEIMKNNQNLIILKKVKNPEKYGVVKILNNKIQKIIEKPKKKLSNLAITGIYFFDKYAYKNARLLKPSKRKETEIVDLIKIYLKKNNLGFKTLNNIKWSDVGTIDDFNKISNFIKLKEFSNKKKIGCLEEILLKNKWINKAQVKKNINFYVEC
jgi:glucose-1-phosphate thymidylyltransferase